MSGRLVTDVTLAITYSMESNEGQTRCKAGTQSHGTSTVSRATNSQDENMDQRGYPLDPTHQAVAGAVPEKRLVAWSALASRSAALSTVPAQHTSAAA